MSKALWIFDEAIAIVNEEGVNAERSSKVKRDVLGPVGYYFEINERRKDEKLSRGLWILTLKQKCNT